MVASPLRQAHPGAPLLEIINAQIIYDGAVEAVRDVSLSVPEGRVVALLGSNGAGKSTLLKAVTGTLHLEEGKLERGAIRFAGGDLGGMTTERIVCNGLVLVPEGRRLFANMTVDENLTMGAHLKSAAQMRRLKDDVYDLFPKLHERRAQISGYLSGGEQQMVAVGRALMAEPRLLALDEPSLGLAPLIIEAIYETIARMRDEMNMTILLVEQNATRAMELADYVYIMETGRIVLDGAAETMRTNQDVQEYYLGMSGGDTDRKSFREVKHYKRRKRWLS
ncbi:ABC transporter ATP-binding protein [uncultured Tistrella sp.]|uniref:ABC transporter ATP-binding protein n=1 Tax=Tistrella mobilis TaxID=171437 RepID=UPI000C0A75CC|nr:ABC transporter ATP-binding protein [uncultured Tistrella sp.]MAM72780.1 ABC transporter ATP-binding protein [Tistrella sp.]